MAKWEDQIGDHAIHDELRSCLAACERAEERDDIDSESLSGLSRITHVIKETQLRLSATDSELLTLAQLNKIQAPLSQINVQVANFSSNGNTGHITNALSQLENVLVHLAGIPSARSSEDVEGIREAVSSFRRSIAQQLRRQQDEVDSLEASSSELKSESSRIRKILEGFEKQTSTFFSESEQRLATLEKNSTSSLETTLSASKERFDALVKSSEEALELKAKELEQLAAEELREFKDRQTKSLDGLVEVVNRSTEEISTRKAEVERLVGVITNTGMVGGYQKQANWERGSAIIWRVLAGLSLLAIVFFAGMLVWDSFQAGYQFSPAASITRVFAGLAAVIFAGYAASQAEKHSKAERWSRRMELELACITPYLKDFPEDEALQIRKDLALRMFGQEERQEKEPGPRVTRGFVARLLGTIEEMARKS